MPHHTKHITTIILTTLALALAITNASANRLSFTNQSIRAAWTSLRLINTVNSSSILCALTLEASYHSATIAKTAGALIGYVTRASITNPCTGGTATIHQESLPWHIRYNSFTGVLPNIAGLKFNLIGVFFEIREASNTCSARTEVEHPAIETANLNSTTHVAESLTPERATRIPLTNGAGGIFCGLANGIFSEESQTLAVLGATTKITVTLI